MSGVRRKRIGIFSLWALIVTIFAHALLPTGSALARTPGSAFSASTSDVSLAPSRKASVAATRQDQPTDGDSGAGANEAAIPLSLTDNVRAGTPGAREKPFLMPDGGRVPAVPDTSVQARAPPVA